MVVCEDDHFIFSLNLKVMKYAIFFLVVFLSLGLTTKETIKYIDKIRSIRDTVFIDNSIPMGFPVKSGKVSSMYGYRNHPILKRLKKHNGIDIQANYGEPVIAKANGFVSRVSFESGGYGNVIELKHNKTLKTRYAHLSKFNVRLSDYVEIGDTIGFVGSTGLSTAPHLHYEVLVGDSFTNPIPYVFNDTTIGRNDSLRIVRNPMGEF